MLSSLVFFKSYSSSNKTSGSSSRSNALVAFPSTPGTTLDTLRIDELSYLMRTLEERVTDDRLSGQIGWTRGKREDDIDVLVKRLVV